MPRRTNDFQRLITFLEGLLAPTGAIVTPSAMLTPTDGTDKREVDILIEHQVGPHAVRIAIECRAHRRKQGVEWINSIVGEYEHLPVHKVVAVSKSGFTKSAEKAAQHCSIDTVTLQQALASDWPQAIATYRVGLVLLNHSMRAAEVNCIDGPEIDLKDQELSIAPVEDATGQRLGTFDDDVQFLYKNFARDDVRVWARTNATEIFRQPPGFVWHVRLSYAARNRFLVPPRGGPRRQISEVVLCLDCSYQFEPAELSYFRYHGALIGAGDVKRVGDPNRYSFSLLFNPDGTPRALNVHQELKALPGANPV
jgi:hypothetical protein